MDVSYIKLMAKYEAIQIRRGWIFKLFVLIVVGINVSQLFIQGNFVRNEWYWMALPSSFPYFQALCFNMVQVLFVIFAVHEVLSREKRDTEAALLVHPISNMERNFGQVLGIAKVVLLTCLVSMVFSMLVNLFASDSPFSLWIYIFYFEFMEDNKMAQEALVAFGMGEKSGDGISSFNICPRCCRVVFV